MMLTQAYSDIKQKREWVASGEKEDARSAIPALCFTEDDIRERLAQEELMRYSECAASTARRAEPIAPWSGWIPGVARPILVAQVRRQ